MEHLTDGVKQDIRQILREELDAHGEPNQDAFLYTRVEAARYCGSTVITIRRWERAGLITPIFRAGRCFYKFGELRAIFEGGLKGRKITRQDVEATMKDLGVDLGETK